MLTRVFLCTVLIAACLAGCGAPKACRDIDVQTRVSPKADLSGYQTYAWEAAAAVVHDPDLEWAPPDLDVAAEVMYLVNRELRDEGMTEVATKPDLSVFFAIGVDMKSLGVDTLPGEASEFADVPKGALLVILAEPDSRRVVWVGSAEADVQPDLSGEVRKERFEYAIKKMFKKFPG